jgi:hypothetical protein
MMKIALAELEQRFEDFKVFLKNVAGEEFKGFKHSRYFDNQENYKYAVYESAKDKLRSKFWKTEDIGSGKIVKEASEALETSVIHHFVQVQNNLINNWRLKDNFKKQVKNRELEQILFGFYKNKVKDEVSFSKLLDEEQPYNLIAYLFFIKDCQKYLPISQERFDDIFLLLGVSDFRTRGNASWENYQTFLDLNKQVRDFLLTKDKETTLLDAHSFLWILGGEMQDVVKKEIKNKTTTDVKNEKLIIKGEEINKPDEDINTLIPITSEVIFPEEISPNQEVLIEGSLRQIIVNAYERNPKARSICIEHHGLNCKVCGFGFEDIYGAAGAGFIHVHHIIPLTEIKTTYEVDPLNDLVPVCPNCHAMLHRFNPILTIEQLKNIIINTHNNVHSETAAQSPNAKPTQAAVCENPTIHPHKTQSHL